MQSINENYPSHKTRVWFVSTCLEKSTFGTWCFANTSCWTYEFSVKSAIAEHWHPHAVFLFLCLGGSFVESIVAEREVAPVEQFSPSATMNSICL